MTVPQCVYCACDSNQAPLLALRFRESELWICSRHLPILIHHPEQLEDRLAGMAEVAPAEEHGHDD